MRREGTREFHGVSLHLSQFPVDGRATRNEAVVVSFRSSDLMIGSFVMRSFPIHR